MREENEGKERINKNNEMSNYTELSNKSPYN